MTNNKHHRGAIYLSGGMQFADNLGSGWRQTLSLQLIALGYLPIDIAALDIAYTAAHGEVYRSLGESELTQRKSNIRKHFVDTDIQLIRQHTDAIIVLYDESVRLGAGTISEVHEAYSLGIPVFLMNSYDTLDAVPGWLQAETTKMFQDWRSLLEYLEQLPPGILLKDRFGNRQTETHHLCFLCGKVEQKLKTHFVSTVTPLYCKECVDVVKRTYDEHADRLDFCVSQLR